MSAREKNMLAYSATGECRSCAVFAHDIMAAERTDELYKVLLEKGYPKELCREIAYKHMNTDYTATRMLGYLYRISNPRVEDLIDEMLAILSDREQIIQKKESERAQAVISDIYRNGL